MSLQVWTHLIDSAALAAHRVEPHPPPDEEWLRTYRANAAYFAARHRARQPWPARLLRRPWPAPPPFVMSLPRRGRRARRAPAFPS